MEIKTLLAIDVENQTNTEIIINLIDILENENREALTEMFNQLSKNLNRLNEIVDYFLLNEQEANHMPEMVYHLAGLVEGAQNYGYLLYALMVKYLQKVKIISYAEDPDVQAIIRLVRFLEETYNYKSLVAEG